MRASVCGLPKYGALVPVRRAVKDWCLLCFDQMLYTRLMILNLLPLVLLLPPVFLLPLVSAIILKTAFIAFCYFELFHFAVNLLL